MKTIQTLSAILSLAATLSTQAEEPSIKVLSHTASEASFLVNSHLIVGSKDAILVDAQFTKSEAHKVVELIQSQKKNLKTIFITHGHPDHYFGLEVLKEAFPKAQILARAQVVKAIDQGFGPKQQYWKPIYKDEIANKKVLPQAFAGASLSLDGQRIRLIDLEAGESEASTALFIESGKTLIAGDAVYSKVHLWLAEGRSEGWLKNIKTLKALSPSRVLPGHGAEGGPELLSRNEQYILDYEKAAASSKTQEELVGQMKALYPSEALPVILEIAAGAKKPKL